MMIFGLILAIICIVCYCIIVIKTSDTGTVFLSAMCGAFMICGIFLMAESPTLSPTPQQICEENSISYGLVQTVAEYTDKSERDIIDFFLIVSDDVEAFEAIQMLDSSLTDAQIDAILEIGAMKQAE